jgi:PKD repeat protein
MRTDAAPLGWGWTVRVGVALIGLAVALTSSAPALRAQAGTVGEWKTLARLMPINPVHTALMNNGQVLIVSGSGNVAAETNFRYAVLDLQADTLSVTNNYPWDMFCNGMVVLSDGRVFVNGGNLAYDPFHGQPKNAVFDPATGVFTDVQNMAHGRWYPTVTTLGDGSVMTFSGLDENGNTNTTVEIYTPGSGWSQQYSAGWTPPLYPRMHLLPNGNVLYSGSGTGSRIFNTTTKTWSGVVATTNYSGTRGYGTSVLLPLRPSNGYKGRVMIFGGGNPATATTEILDTSAQTLQWQNGPAMSQPRIEMNATLLPNGKILATGGSTKDEDTTTKSLNADLYDPVSNTFSSAGQNVYARVYHSNALLLPDATVLLLGGNPARGTYEQHMEIYSPAYLFNGDGSPAARPTIASVTPGGFTYNGTFQIQTPDAANIASVVLVRPGAPTHAFDMEQRLVELTFTAGAGVLNATAPPNGNIAPPGYYMLFILNSAGVPSVATFVRISTAPPNQAPTASIDSPASNVTINTGDVVAFSGSGSDPDGTITSYAWTFPGGSPASSAVAAPGNVTYSTAGSYTATFKVTDNGGLSSSTQTRTITVSAPPNQPPTASIDSPASNVTVNPGDTVAFSGSGLDADGTIASYAWTFPGGSPSSSSAATPGNVTYSAPGTYTATFKVTDNGGLSSTTQTRTITVADFSLSATPSSMTVASGGNADYTATVTPAFGFNGTVTFSVTGLPSGASASFTPASVVGSGTTTMTVTTLATTLAGTYPLTIRGTSGSVTRTAAVTLVVTPVGDFTIAVSPASATVNNGNNATYTVTIAAVAGFNGTVSLTTGTLPKFVSASFSPATVNQSGTSVLTLSTKKQTKNVSATITVRGTSGTLVHSFNITLVVQ